MLIALLFIIASLALGHSLSSFLKFRKSLSEEIAVSTVLGFACTAFVIFILAYLQSTLNELTIFIVSAAAIMAHLWLTQKRKTVYPKINWTAAPSFVVAFLLFALISFFLVSAFWVDSEGAIYSITNAWGDYPFHFGVITSFASGDNFPPQYPNLAATPMRYPFLFDFLSSILVVGGFSLQMAVLVPGILTAFSVVFLARMLALELGKSELAAAACLLFFFLNGPLASWAFLEDFSKAPDKLAFLQKPADYASPGEQQAGLANFIITILVPQRTALMGLALALLAYYLLYRIYSGQAHKTDYLFAGLSVALLPLVHMASFAVAAVAFGFVVLHEAWRSKLAGLAKNKKMQLMVLLVILLAVPQLLWINEQPRATGFFGVQGGWLAKTTDIWQIMLFWIRNAGIVLPLAFVGLLTVNPKRRLVYVPFLLVFLAANLFRLQPWDWDNTKYFLHWMLFTAVFAGIGLNWLWQRTAAKSKAIGNALVAVLLFSGVLSGAVALWYWPLSSAKLFSAGDVKAAELVMQNTPPKALVLTAMRHNEPVYSLAGRQVVMGYAGHTWSHGLEDLKQVQTVNKAFSTGEFCTGAFVPSYIFVGPQEEEDYRAAYQVINNSPNASLVFDESLEGRHYRLFKTTCRIV